MHMVFKVSLSNGSSCNGHYTAPEQCKMHMQVILFFSFYYSYSFIINDANQDHPNEETYRKRSGRVPSAKLLGPQDTFSSWRTDVCH